MRLKRGFAAVLAAAVTATSLSIAVFAQAEGHPGKDQMTVTSRTEKNYYKSGDTVKVILSADIGASTKDMGINHYQFDLQYNPDILDRSTMKASSMNTFNGNGEEERSFVYFSLPTQDTIRIIGNKDIGVSSSNMNANPVKGDDFLAIEFVVDPAKTIAGEGSFHDIFSFVAPKICAMAYYPGGTVSLNKEDLISFESFNASISPYKLVQGVKAAIKIDNIAPVITLNGQAYEGALNKLFIDDVVVQVEENHLQSITLNGVEIENGTVINQDGRYEIVATDETGNQTSVIFTRDASAPNIWDVEDGKHYNENVYPKYNEGTGLLNGLPFASGDEVNEEGEYTLVVTKENGKSDTVQFVIDKTPPVVNLDTVDANNQSKDPVTVTYSDKYLESATINGVPFESGMIVKEPGSYVVVVTDQAGNVTTREFEIVPGELEDLDVTFHWASDGQPIDLNAQVPNYDGVYYFNEDIYVDYNPVDGITSQLNGKDYVSKELINEETEYKLIFSGDSPLELSYQFVVDKTPPQVSGVENEGEYSQPVTIQFSDKNLNYASLGRLDEETGEYVSVEVETGFTVDTDGTYCLTVVDKAGNMTEVVFTYAADTSLEESSSSTSSEESSSSSSEEESSQGTTSTTSKPNPPTGGGTMGLLSLSLLVVGLGTVTAVTFKKRNRSS